MFCKELEPVAGRRLMSDETTPGTPGPEAGTVGAPPEGDGQPRSVIDASVDFVQTSVAYARQEIGAAVRDKAIVPVQDTAIDVAVLLAMALTLALGVAFIAVGLLLVVAGLIGWPATMFVIGGVLLIAAIVVMLVVRRRMEARKQSL
jgi:hypothetical protein